MSVSAISVGLGARKRWWQLGLGLIVMASISSPQYTWTIFTGPMTKVYGVPLSTLQITFFLLIGFQTFLSPFQAGLVERFGARSLVSLGAAMSGLAWVLSAYAPNLYALYLTYGVIGGVGTGIVYIGVIGLMVRWFPDRRGFAAGVVAAGYGMGAILTNNAIYAMVNSPDWGYANTLLLWGVVQGILGFAAAQGLRSPPSADERAPAAALSTPAESPRSVGPAEMLKSPIFYLMFIMMAMMSTGGLMVVSNVGAFAKYYKVADVLVFGTAALTLSLNLSRFANGLTRPFFGWVSDHVGRENTMGLAFLLEAAAILIMFRFIDQPALFVVLTGAVFFGWGEIFSLFPSTLTDTFGAKFATTNYGCLYIAQGVGSLLGGFVAARLQEMTGDWMIVFAIVAALDALTAILALTVLKSMRRRYLGMQTAPGRTAPRIA